MKTKVQPINEPMLIAEKFTLRSSILGETRTFYVHLPDGYSNKANQYPVLYLLDGKSKMQKTVAVTDDLANFSRRIPQMVVIGIETNENRKADLSTFSSSLKFLSFITTELKPYIESQYKTNGENLLMGSSMGGEFVVRALFEQPEQFDGYFAISPSIYYSDFQLVDKANELAKSNKIMNKALYLSLANEGWNQGVEELVYHLQKNPIQGLKWYFDKHEEESHGSISLGQSTRDLQDYYQAWAAPHFRNTHDFESKGGLKGLQKVYRLRTPSIIPISILGHMALLYVDQKHSQNAIELSLFAVKEHPTSGRALRNLAYVYEEFSMLKKALLTYKKAVSVAILNKHKVSSIESHRKALTTFKAKYIN
jgi:predicted alpha/beta superfamily hydrolase